MSTSKWEEEAVTEIEPGGELNEKWHPKLKPLANMRGGLSLNGASVGGVFNGPPELVPMVTTTAAMIAGGIIWAMFAWQAGLAVMVGSLITNIIFVLSVSRTRKRRRGK